MLGRLDNFHVIFVRRPSGDFQSRSHQRFLEVAVKFVTMPVAFADFQLAVRFVRERARLQLARPRAQAHCAAHFVHAQQFAQFVNHAVRRLRIELRAVRLFQTCGVARVFNRRALHSEANPEERHFVLARILNRVNHPLNPALAKSARHENPVVAVQPPRRRLRRINFFRLDPVQRRFMVVRQPAVQQSFAQTLVRVFQLHVLPNHGDSRFASRMMHAVNQIDPRLHVRWPRLQLQQPQNLRV